MRVVQIRGKKKMRAAGLPKRKCDQIMALISGLHDEWIEDYTDVAAAIVQLRPDRHLYKADLERCSRYATKRALQSALLPCESIEDVLFDVYEAYKRDPPRVVVYMGREESDDSVRHIIKVVK